jgi:hypothetical protein
MRDGDEIYHADNIPLARIVKPANFLQLEFEAYGKEKDHLRQAVTEVDGELLNQVKELREQGKSFREIGDELGISYKKAERLLR